MDSGESVVSHHEAGMAGVQNPAECLCEIIGWVDNARDVLELNVSKFVPLLEPKVANLHMARAFSGLGVVDNLDGGLIVFKGIDAFSSPESPICKCASIATLASFK